MGKNKGQRTKNNARPSNSNRSAELLGASAPSFVGFTAAKDGGYVPLLPGLSITKNTEMSNIDSQFQLVFKKMNKKDATTKYKALQEFSELCTNQELSTIEAILPFWPRLYYSLASDVDHRVREAAQLAHATLVKRVGKTIATYLKQLAGPWFVSKYDLYPPAASAATNSFNSTFPPQKFVSAIVHCQEEILTYICENITVVTPQSLSSSTNKTLTPEELESKYQRIITSSLQAYSFYLKTVSPADIEKTAEYHRKLISNSKFWKLAKNELPSTKTAFFSALTALVSHATDVVCEEKKKVLTTVINSLDEAEPALLSAVWECLLVTINKVEDWHKVVSIEKLILPKLWKVLKNGGQFCASVVYPNLLPFLSHFIKFEINKVNLFTNFFENMREGFSVKSVKFSRSETFAVVTSFFECFRYAILINCNEEDFCDSLLKEQLIPVIESCIVENETVRSSFFCELSHLVRYWCKNSKNSEYPAYGKVMKSFWFELIAIFNRLVDQSSENYDNKTGSIVNAMAELLTYLKNAPSHSRRNMKVKFSDSETTTSPSSPSSDAPLVSNNDSDVFLEELQQLVTKLCVSYFKRITDKPSKHKVIHLVKIMSGLESKELFLALAKTYDENASLLQFYNQNLKLLMTTESEDVEDLIHLIFSIMSHMSNSEKYEVLQSFQEVKDVRILKTAVRCALTNKYRDDLVVQDWCKQTVITNTLVLTAQDTVSTLEFADPDEIMFMKAFEPTKDGELIVSSEAVMGIASLLSLMVDRMPWKNEKQTQRIANLLSRLSLVSWTHKEVNSGELKLLKSLFRLHIRDIAEKIEDESINIDIDIVQEAWTKGLCEVSKRFSQTTFIEHVKYFASMIWEKIFSSSDIIKDSLIDLSANLIDAVITTGSHYSENLVITFITELDITKWMKNSSSIIHYAEAITGNLYVSSLLQKSKIFNDKFEIDLSNENFEDDTHKCLKWAVASAKVLNKLIIDEADFPEISEILLNLSYVATLSELYVKHYNSTKYSNNVSVLHNFLQEELKILKTHLSEDIHNKVINDLNRLILSFGGVYSHTLRFYSNFFKPKNDLSEIFGDGIVESAKKSNNIEVFLQSAQALRHCLHLQNILMTLDDGSDFYKIFLARNQFEESDFVSSLEEIYEKINKRQQSEPLTLLLDCDIHDASWEEFILPLETISFLTKCVTTMPKRLTLSQWDTIEICLASWCLSVRKSLKHFEDFKVKSLVVSVSKLYTAVQQIMNIHSKQPIEELPPSLLDEWRNVFATELQSGIFETWMTLAELYGEKDAAVVSVIPINYVGKALKVLDGPLLSESKDKKQGKSEEEILDLLLKLVHSPVLSLQLGTYVALTNVAGILIERDMAIIEEEDFDIKSLNIYKLESVLGAAQTIVNAILMDFKLCDTVSCTIQPYTDSYTYTVGYLFTWGVILNMCARANADLRFNYAEILKDDFFPSLLNNLFRLMPIEVLQDSKSKSHKLAELFSTIPSFNFAESWTESRLDHLVCRTYTNCLRYLPVLVRQWWSTADSRVSAAVDKITTAYVSPFLCNEELHDNRLTKFENMQIKIHPTAREVVALYQMDDTKLELNIILPPNHPLGTVTVEPGQHAGGAANWRNCHMQLSIFLTHQNGSIWDGLMLWKANLDKRFAGVEECYICFSIFHISTNQIPKLCCRTCRKKFHKACLYKWFNTSHKSTCPICRNEF